MPAYLIMLMALLWAWPGGLQAAALDIGQFDRPKDLTLRITDPFLQENNDLMQPVVGRYTVKILPEKTPEEGPGSARYLCQGLYFKQVGSVIYIDIRKPPAQERAGYFDLSVLLSLGKDGDFSSRQKRNIRYVNSATDVVLAIDNSSSMRKNDPHGRRFDAAENFIHLSALSSQISQVAILRFASTAKLVMPWTPPKDVGDINELLRRSKTGNFTNINDALRFGARLFEDSSASEKVLVLLTDGKNEPDRYADTHRQLRELGVKVFTVGLSEQSDSKLLRTIADDTGGSFFKATDDENLLKIYNQIASQIGDFRTMADGTAEKELEFTVSSSDHIVNINVFGHEKDNRFILVDPAGHPVQLKELSTKRQGSTALFRLHEPDPGKYRLKITGGAKTAFKYTLSSHSDLFLKSFPLESKYLRGEVVHFAVSLAEHEKPIIQVPITGTITDAAGKTMHDLVLHDDGVHGDNHADDGVYCGIWPLDLPEGAYTVNYRAYGSDFTRMDKRGFYVLESGKDLEDYFLASVLPLYLDLGSIEQGGSKSSSLRLSFEGRRPRQVVFKKGKDLRLGKNGPLLDWSAVEWPKTGLCKPSEPVIHTLRFNIPPRAAPGAYTGSFKIAMGDQVIEIPVDLAVQARASHSGPDEVVSATRRRITAPSLPVVTAEPRKPALTPKALVEATPSGPALARPDMNKSGGSGNLVAADLPIEFSVTPTEPQTFSASPGQFASARYEVINHSSHAGTIAVKLESGPGSIDIKQIELAAGARQSVYWSWDMRDVPPSGTAIDIRFSHRGKDATRKITWHAPQRNLLFFYITLLLLGASTLYNGAAYLARHQSNNLFLTLSSAGHFILVVVLFLTLLPARAPDKQEEELIELVLSPEAPPAAAPAAEPVVSNPPTPAPEPESQPQKLAIEPQHQADEPRRLSVNQRVQDRVRAQAIDLQQFERQADSERSWTLDKKSDAPVEPVVLSVNDRPEHRAVLVKSSEPEDDARDLTTPDAREQRPTKPARERPVQQRAPEREIPLSDWQREPATTLSYQAQDPKPASAPAAPPQPEIAGEAPRQTLQTRGEQVLAGEASRTEAERSKESDLRRSEATALVREPLAAASAPQLRDASRAVTPRLQPSATTMTTPGGHVQASTVPVAVPSESPAIRALRAQASQPLLARSVAPEQVARNTTPSRMETDSLLAADRGPAFVRPDASMIQHTTEVLQAPAARLDGATWKPAQGPSGASMAPTAVVAPASRVVTQQSTASLQRELKKEVTPETVARETQPEAPQQEEPQKQEAPLLGEKAKQQATLPRNLDGSQAELFEQKRSTIELQRPLRQTRSRAENPQTEISSPELHR